MSIDSDTEPWPPLNLLNHKKWKVIMFCPRQTERQTVDKGGTFYTKQDNLCFIFLSLLGRAGENSFTAIKLLMIKLDTLAACVVYGLKMTKEHAGYSSSSDTLCVCCTVETKKCSITINPIKSNFVILMLLE